MKIMITAFIMTLMMTGQAESRYKIAVIDSGFNKLRLLTDNIPLCKEGHYNFISDRNDLGYDVMGHGTAVTKLIDANASVNNKKRCFLIYKIFQNSYTTDEMIAKAIVMASNRGAKVINLSLGGIGYSKLVNDALKYATSRGARIFVAAGNSSINLNHSCTVFPACAKVKNVMVVGALNRSYQTATYSNYGLKVDLWERGDAFGMQGTSFASPRAAGRHLRSIGK